jgi:hypothetical protein
VTRNPYSAESDGDKYVCIWAAGFHMFGTAFALKMLSKPSNFSSHPYGGVVRVDIDEDLPFGERFDNANPNWDSDGGGTRKSDYNHDQLESSLEALVDGIDKNSKFNVSATELAASLELIRNLKGDTH